jgi:hypothetical protein
MTTSTFFSDVSDGRVESTSTVYATARAGAGLSVNTTSTTTSFGQNFTTPNYVLRQVFLGFDTSSIPDTDTIDSVVLSLSGTIDPGDNNDDPEARIFDWGTTVETTDWRDGTAYNALTRVATRDNSITWSVVGYNDFASDGTFITNINTTGFTRLVVCTAEFAAAGAPLIDERFGLFMADQADTTNDPKLVVNHTAAGGGGAAVDPFGMSGFFGA